MTIEFSLSKKQLEMREGIRGLAKNVIRPQALAWDREGGIPEDFVRNMARLAASLGSSTMRSGLGDETEGEMKEAEIAGLDARSNHVGEIPFSAPEVGVGQR